MIWKRKITLEALNAMGEGNMVGLLDIRFEHIGDDTLEATTSNNGVANGIRTHDNWNHNPGLYQLSYSHHYKSCYAVLLPPQLKRRD